jgi:hypothetical protein
MGPVDFEAGRIGVQASQLQGIRPDGLADHRRVDAVQACCPQRIERPAQAVVVEVRRLHRALEDHLRVIAGQGVRHTRQRMLAGENDMVRTKASTHFPTVTSLRS